MVTSCALSRSQALMMISPVLLTVSQTWVGHTPERGFLDRNLYLQSFYWLCWICTVRWWLSICIVSLDRNLYLLGILFPIVWSHGVCPWARQPATGSGQTIPYRLHHFLPLFAPFFTNFCTILYHFLHHFVPFLAKCCATKQWQYWSDFSIDFAQFCTQGTQCKRQAKVNAM